jgi:hypothetical protein
VRLTQVHIAIAYKSWPKFNLLVHRIINSRHPLQKGNDKVLIQSDCKIILKRACFNNKLLPLDTFYFIFVHTKVRLNKQSNIFAIRFKPI